MTDDESPPFGSPLAALVVASADGGFNAGGFAAIDAALRADRLDSEGHFLLPLLEPALRRHVPDWDFLPIAAGLRRRARLEAAMASQLAEAVRTQLLSRDVDAVLVGDLAAARVLHGQILGPGRIDHHVGVRRASLARILVPRGASRTRVREALRSTAEDAGATILGRPRAGLALHGVQVRVSQSTGVAFTFPRARESAWRRVEPVHRGGSSPSLTPGGQALPTPSAEFLMFESIAGSSLGPPRIRWLVDAVAARQRGLAFDWDEVVAIAEEHHWSDPVHRAIRSLADAGWDIPESALVRAPSGDFAVDRALQRAVERRPTSASRRDSAVLAPLVAGRNVRHWRRVR